MSPNNPYQPGEGADADNHASSHETHAGQHDPLESNPYSAQYRESAVPDLDAGAPRLRSNELRRMNQRALLMLSVVALALLFVIFWLVKGPSSHNQQPKQREEKVTVAEAPRPTPASVPQLPPPTPAEPIALATQPALPSVAMKPAAPVHAGPSLLDRRIVSGESEGAQAQAAPPASESSNGGHLDGLTEVANAQPLTHPGTLMQRGTYIRCVLETRIVSDIPGFSTCLVTEPVYSFTGRQLLLPKGSKVLGSYQKPPPGRRIAIIWDRIITPTGIDVSMSSPGIDNLGGSGNEGHYDAHWSSRISAALLISILSDAFKYEGEKHGPRSTTLTNNGLAVQEPFQSNTAETLQNLSNQATQEAANRKPTITINQGTVVYIYVARDVDFSGVVAKF